MRARRAGFELAVAHDLFVHHFGSRTFVGNGIDAERLLEENGRRFAEKWGTAVARGQSVSLMPWTGGPNDRERNGPRMNTDFHGWEPGTPLAQRNGAGHGSPSSDTQSDPCSIRVSSVAQNLSCKKATTSLTMIVRNEQENMPACLASVAGCR
jgi:hypothetical protein